MFSSLCAANSGSLDPSMFSSKFSSDGALIAEYENAGDSSKARRCWFRLDVLRLCVEEDDTGDDTVWPRLSIPVWCEEAMEALDDAARMEGIDGDAAICRGLLSLSRLAKRFCNWYLLG